MSPALQRTLYWTTTLVAWVFGAGLLYLATVFILLGPMLGPRGDIDYPDFTEAQKASANREAVVTQCLGLVPLTAAGFVFFFGGRLARRIGGVGPKADARGVG